MPNKERLVRLYELSGEPPGSPYCYLSRFALDSKGIPFAVSKVSFPAIRPTCEKFFPAWKVFRPQCQSQKSSVQHTKF